MTSSVELPSTIVVRLNQLKIVDLLNLFIMKPIVKSQMLKIEKSF